ncbi:hypothetical protein P154DRAFT_557001 [Amniculicola lignicola CBS 123094]|uniref:HTH CENPB-type domain-containing protein n=1 Tax=Amniculicola lignicola CBS 123094 TaxID=1392246 RepID=A0A6A5W4E1_9PLEO|nr:hypothetical protein P154DRAFT_557001 [Amniculicola lignicola CBS 123094]
MDPIQAAIDDIESLPPGETLSYTKTAAKYSVVQSTLIQRHKGITQPPEVKNSNQQKLTLQQEQELVQYIKSLTERHIPPTREIVQNFASAIAKEPIDPRHTYNMDEKGFLIGVISRSKRIFSR